MHGSLIYDIYLVETNYIMGVARKSDMIGTYPIKENIGSI